MPTYGNLSPPSLNFTNDGNVSPDHYLDSFGVPISGSVANLEGQTRPQSGRNPWFNGTFLSPTRTVAGRPPAEKYWWSGTHVEEVLKWFEDVHSFHGRGGSLVPWQFPNGEACDPVNATGNQFDGHSWVNPDWWAHIYRNFYRAFGYTSFSPTEEENILHNCQRQFTSYFGPFVGLSIGPPGILATDVLCPISVITGTFDNDVKAYSLSGSNYVTGGFAELILLALPTSDLDGADTLKRILGDLKAVCLKPDYDLTVGYQWLAGSAGNLKTSYPTSDISPTIIGTATAATNNVLPIPSGFLNSVRPSPGDMPVLTFALSFPTGISLTNDFDVSWCNPAATGYAHNYKADGTNFARLSFDDVVCEMIQNVIRLDTKL